MHTERQVAFVLSLANGGLNDCQIARETGVPRTTIGMWRRGRVPSFGHARGTNPGKPLGSTCDIEQHPVLPSSCYAYLLGQYLGDGTISRSSRGVFKLRIFSFSGYPGIIEECSAAMRAVMPTNRVTVVPVPGVRLVVITSYSKHWPCLFPQFGPGRKHERPIRLTHWQQSIVEHHPEQFLRGLIHSDGCRVMNRVKDRRYAYPRYNFSNASDDIRRLFTDACDQLGVRWRQMNARNISVARRDSVAIMDTFIGPKA
jgi:hypothetical protein